MALIKWSSPSNLSYPRVSDIFDHVFNDLDSFAATELYRDTPAVNILEDENNFHLEMAAPGLLRDRFNIRIEKDVLAISVEKPENDEKKEGLKFRRKEYSFQEFKRAFRLPETADAEKITASYENGVLGIVIPKREETKPRDIKVG